jgi:hypothetical protein
MEIDVRKVLWFEFVARKAQSKWVWTEARAGTSSSTLIFLLSSTKVANIDSFNVHLNHELGVDIIQAAVYNSHSEFHNPSCCSLTVMHTP